jgi:hypothetical protein
MNLLRTAQRTFSLSFDGLREALVVVAERVALRVHAGKLQLHAEDTESRLGQAYESLGQCLYGTHHASPGKGAPIDTALPIVARIRIEHQVLQELRDQMASLYDETLTLPLSRLQDDLKKGGGTVERVTITPGSQADGKRLADLDLPATVRLIVLRRGTTLIIPSGSVVLQAGDDITLLGNRSAIPAALRILRV